MFWWLYPLQASSDFVDSVRFTFYTPEEVRRISVKKITKPDLFDAKDAPIVDGLYDPALGPLDKIDSWVRNSNLTKFWKILYEFHIIMTFIFHLCGLWQLEHMCAASILDIQCVFNLNVI